MDFVLVYMRQISFRFWTAWECNSHVSQAVLSNVSKWRIKYQVAFDNISLNEYDDDDEYIKLLINKLNLMAVLLHMFNDERPGSLGWCTFTLLYMGKCAPTQ